MKLSENSLLNMASAAARCSRVICPVRRLIDMADDISVTVQSLIRSSAASCSASHDCIRGVIASLESDDAADINSVVF